MDKTFAAELRGQVLRDSSATTTTRTAYSGVSRTDPVYVLPDTASSQDRLAFLAHLVTRGQSTSRDRQHWRSFVLTVVGAAFPQLGNKVVSEQPRMYEVIVCTDAEVQMMHEHLAACAAWSQIEVTDAAQQTEARATAAALIPPFDRLPPVTDAMVDPRLSECTSMEALYGWVSLVLFLAGKTITNDNRTAITTRRPLAIERKYGLGSVPCLSGRLRLSDVSHMTIPIAYTSLSQARRAIFEDVAQFGGITSDPGVEITATTTRLMAYTGMQHVVIIDRFLSASPEATKIPMLASSLVYYVSSLQQLQQTPPMLRPFFKLMHGDTTRAFNRRDVESLMVVAISTDAQTNPTMNNYRLPDNAGDIRKAYNQAMIALGNMEAPEQEAE